MQEERERECEREPKEGRETQKETLKKYDNREAG
jgi:hypothetical protein